MASLIVRPEAEVDLQTTMAFFAETDVELAERLLLEFRDAITALRSFPRAGRIVYQGMRRVTLHVFPYGVFYRYSGDRVVVIAVLHHRRDPNWTRTTVVSRR